MGPNNYLLDYLGSFFTLMYFTKSGSFPEALTSVVDDHHSRGMPLQVLVVGSEAALGSVRALPDADGHVRQSYGVAADGAAYLLRPDQHICARWLTLDADRLNAALSTALPRQPSMACVATS
jgi:3-(3-hydroxy-phenyl)propionate hydroxylase